VKLKSWKIELIVILLFAVTSLFPAAVLAATYDTAVELYEAGEYGAARDLLEELYEADPADEGVLYHLYLLEEETGTPEETFYYLAQLAERSPDELEILSPRAVYQAAGLLAYEIAEYRRALEFFEKALEEVEDENKEESLRTWRDRSRSAYLRRVRLDREAELSALRNEAARLASEGKVGEAIELLKAQQDEFENYAELETLLADLQREQRFFNWMEQVEEVSLETPSNEIDQLIDEGRSEFFDVERYEETTRNYMGRLFYIRGIQHYLDDQFSEAKDRFENALAFSLEAYPEYFQELARSNYRLGNYEQTDENLKLLERQFPEFDADSWLAWKNWFRLNLDIFITVFLLLGLVLGTIFLFGPLFGSRLITSVGVKLTSLLMRINQTAAAALVFDRLCQVEFLENDAFKKYITALEQTGEDNKIREALETFKNAKGLSRSQKIKLAQIYRNAGENDRASEILTGVYNAWEKLKQKDKAVLARLLSALKLEQGKTEEALELFGRLLKLQPRNNRLYQQVIKLAAESEKWNLWTKYGRQWMKQVKSGYIQDRHRATISTAREEGGLQDPESIAEFLLEVYEQKVSDLSEQPLNRLRFVCELTEEIPGGWERTVDVLKEIIERQLSEEEQRKFLRRLADILAERGQFEQALPYYEKLRELAGDEFDLLEKLGRIYQQLDMRAEAVDCYQKIFNYQKDNVSAISGLKQIGRDYEADEEYEKAESTYRTVLENSRSAEPDVQFRVGVAQYRQDKLEEALSTFQKIKHTRLDFQARVLSYVARCLVKMEMHEAAYKRIEEFEYDARELSSNQRRNLRYWLARAAEGAGQTAEAKSHYQTIVAGDVEFRDAAARLKRLEKL